MTRKKLLILLGSVCLALMLVAMACAAPAPSPTPSPTPTPTPTPVPQQFDWILFAEDSPTCWFWEYYGYWFDYMAEQTDGAINISKRTIGELPYMGEDEMWIVIENKVDLVIAWDCHQGGWRDWTEVSTLPAMFESREQAIACTKEVFVPFWNKMGEKEGFVVLGCITDSPEDLWSSFDVPSVDALKGKKIRAAAPSLQLLLKELGAIPCDISYSEVIMAAERGVISAATTSINDGVADSWYETLKYAYLGSFAFAQSFPTINRNIFLELPEAWQVLLVESAKRMLTDTMIAYRGDFFEENKRSLGGLGGVVIYPTEADKETIAAAGLKVQKEWMEQPGRSEEAKELYQLVLKWKSQN